MCKLMTMTNTKKIKKDQIDQIVKTTSKTMFKSERDGLGITILGNQGIYVRKYLNPLEASLFDPINSRLPFLKVDSMESGQLDSIDSLTVHGRTSTNRPGLKNCHPIARNDFYLSHNGVVEDSGPKYDMMTDNDTEHIVERFSQGIDQVEKHISGYYAFSAYQQGTKNHFVVKDNIASLFFAEIPSLDCHIFATTRELILDIFKILGIDSTKIGEVDDNLMMTYVDGTMTAFQKISPKGRSSYTDSLSHLSLGHSLDPSNSVQDDSSFSDNENMFLYESINDSDSTWAFFLDGYPLSHDQFLELDEESKLESMVIRADGTICSPDNELNGQLYSGQVG